MRVQIFNNNSRLSLSCALKPSSQAEETQMQTSVTAESWRSCPLGSTHQSNSHQLPGCFFLLMGFTRRAPNRVLSSLQREQTLHISAGGTQLFHGMIVAENLTPVTNRQTKMFHEQTKLVTCRMTQGQIE